MNKVNIHLWKKIVESKPNYLGYENDWNVYIEKRNEIF